MSEDHNKPNALTSGNDNVCIGLACGSSITSSNQNIDITDEMIFDNNLERIINLLVSYKNRGFDQLYCGYDSSMYVYKSKT